MNMAVDNKSFLHIDSPLYIFFLSKNIYQITRKREQEIALYAPPPTQPSMIPGGVYPLP